jgi:GT2 family glycosyltransferase
MAEFKDPTVGIASPKLLFPEGCQHGPAGKVQHSGMCWNIQAWPIHVHIGWRADHPRVNQRRDDLDCVTGALLMTRRDVWERIGGFDSSYGRGTFEDCEYSCRVSHEFGLKIAYQPQAVAYHSVGASAMVDGQGYPLQKNHSIFLERMGRHLVWNEFRFW